MSDLQIFIFSIFLIGLILLAAFFSCAETAVMAVNRYRLKHHARQKKRYAMRMMHLLKRPDRLLGTILIGSTFSNILASSVATLIAFHYFGDKGAILSAVILTLVILIFAELLPKTITILYPDKIVKWAVYPVMFFLKLFYPVVWLANTFINNLLKLFNIRLTKATIDPLSRDELRSIVLDTTSKFSRQYQNMLLGILDLNKLTVDDVIIPVYDLHGIDLNEDWQKIVKKISSNKNDNLIVYRDHLNQMVGIIPVAKLLQAMMSKQPLNQETILNYIEEPYFVPEGTSLQLQLNYFQQQHHKIAFVVDEYGEIVGMITFNDILKEIIGDFTASLSNIKKVVEQKDKSFIVSGAITIREFNRITDFKLPIDGPRTINGLIVEHLQSLPHIGTGLKINGHPIEILEVSDNRVKSAKIMPRIS